MKVLRLFLTIFGGLGITVGLTLVLFIFSLNLPGTPALAGGAVRYVTTIGNDAGNDCLDSGNPCATVQHAVDAANEGDEVRVAEGMYTGVNGRPAPIGYEYGSSVITQVLYISKTISVLGGYTTTNWNSSNPTLHPTTLDAQGQGRAIVVGTTITPLIGTISPIIKGFQIINGDAAGLGGSYMDDIGGGVLVIVVSGTITLEDNLVLNNIATDGGGIYIRVGEGLFIHNLIQENTASEEGGGIFSYGDMTLINNDILTNTALLDGGGIHSGNNGVSFINNAIRGNLSEDDGGGIYYIGAYPNGSGAEFINNTIEKNLAYDYGGGLAVDERAHATMIGNYIHQNHGSFGGGMAIADSFSAFMDSNIFADNSAFNGGGLLLLKMGTSGASEFINNTIINNYATSEGGGIFAEATKTHFIHTTIARNTGGTGSGIYLDPFYDFGWFYNQIWMTNTIIISQTIGVYATLSSTAALNGVLWFDNLANTDGTGIINVINEHTGDPAFAPDGYHLTANSAAIDKGIPTNVITDMDGESRPYGLAPDLGADESFISNSPTEINLNGPTTGFVNTSYTFTAIVSPLTTTLPITYIWQADDQTPITHTTGISDTVTFIWSTPGTKTITVTADNGFGTVNTTFTIEIAPTDYKIYLPIVTR